ncbi:MAG: carbamoyl-phosphate synthase large subunit [Acidimicrobiia bacterium]
MPRRDDLHKILILGSGPIVIGQACEFDYSGTQACRVLGELGYEVVLVNSNPATIMTDPEFAAATYLEPLTAAYVEKVIEAERPDALLPTMGGQTALNVTVELAESGVLDRHGVELIGANLDAIRTAEDREAFKAAMVEIGLEVARSAIAHTVDEALSACDEIGYPVVVRPAFTLGGGGSGFAADPDELRSVVGLGLRLSPVSQVLIEESIAGWKEYELEVMRDLDDNVVIICSIENVDPMGVHTGDSITVAPAQTLTDVEYQVLRDAAIACIRRIGVETGGSNIQFAVDPDDGRVVVIEMNPRVSRSSALASKATGFPIAKMAAQLAVGYTLDEIPNDITKSTPACFEPVIDYVVTKVPRWAFEKFPGADDLLGTTMRSVGEVMAIGRTWPESLQKAMRSLEEGRAGLNADSAEVAVEAMSLDEILAAIPFPRPGRLFLVEAALRKGASVDDVYAATRIDRWFLDGIRRIGEARGLLAARGFDGCGAAALRDAKRLGFGDAQLAYLWGVDEKAVRDKRKALGVIPTYKTVDTCAAEFDARTPYHYSTYEDEDEVSVSERPRAVILGSGPNRIGQGVEFDYCCVHAVYALAEAGYETVMVNCNPETVSTDYDTADQLFFEPLTVEDVLAVIDAVTPAGVLLQLGGQTPLKLAAALEAEGVPIAGTPPAAIDAAEDRELFAAACERLGLAQPSGGIALTPEETIHVADGIGYPVLVRPSYVLGGQAMDIVYTASELESATVRLVERGAYASGPVLVDRFLEDAVEVDADALFDGETFCLGGILEHIEEAGVHSGDSACVLPPQTLTDAMCARIESATEALARELGVRGLVNVQYAVRDDVLYVIEANPRASRTVPFISKAVDVPLAKLAARISMGERLADLEAAGVFQPPPLRTPYVSVKEAVLPFLKFPGADALIGPEMRSTGEVMGIDTTFGAAFAKSQTAAGVNMPAHKARIFMSLAPRDKRPQMLDTARHFADLGYEIVATEGTAAWLAEGSVPVSEVIGKISLPAVAGPDAQRRSVLDLLEEGCLDIIVNTPRGRGSRADGAYIRSAAAAAGVAIITTAAGAAATVSAIEAESGGLGVASLQEWHGSLP